MSKQTGLGARAFVSGYDLSGDVNALNNANNVQTLNDVTVIQDLAMSRLVGLKDGALSFNAWMDPETGHQHDAWTDGSGQVPSADAHLIFALATAPASGVAVGDPACMLVAKEASYNADRPAGGPIAATAEFQANGSGLEWGVMLTAGKVTHASATAGSSIDGTAASSDGAVAQWQVFELDSGTVDGEIQDSADDITFATVTGLEFTGLAARGSERVAVTGTIRRYVKFASTGTFTNADLAVAFQRL